MVACLAALAQETRLAIYRLLVRQGPEGLCPGDLQAKLKLAPATLSFHLKELSSAGLLKSRQDGRFLYYSPDFSVMNDMLGFLTDHCCEGGTCDPACKPVAAKKRKSK